LRENFNKNVKSFQAGMQL